MGEIQNSDVQLEMIDRLKLPSSNLSSNLKISDNISAVYTVNPSGRTRRVYRSLSTYTTSITVPAGRKWVINYGTIAWTASATVGNRNIGFYIKDSNNAFLWREVSTVNQTATQLKYYTLNPNAAICAATGTNNDIPIPFGLELKEGDNIIINDSASIDAADTFTLNLSFRDMPGI